MIRLYRVIVVDLPGEGEYNWEPDGWEEYCAENCWPDGPYDDPPAFHWPNENKVYRSRSAATSALKRFERWGAVAYLAESEPEWVSVAEANARRATARRQLRIDKLQAQIDALKARVAA